MTNLSIFSRSKSKSKTHARTHVHNRNLSVPRSTREKYVLSSRFMGFSFILDHYRDWTHLSKSKHLLYTLFLLHFVRFGGQRQKKIHFRLLFAIRGLHCRSVTISFFPSSSFAMLLLLLLCFLLSVCVPTWFRLNMLFLLFFLCVSTARKMLAMTTMRHQ